MAQSKVMPDVLTDEEMDKLSSGMPDTLSDEEMASLESAPSGPPTIKQEWGENWRQAKEEVAARSAKDAKESGGPTLLGGLNVVGTAARMVAKDFLAIPKGMIKTEMPETAKKVSEVKQKLGPNFFTSAMAPELKEPIKKAVGAVAAKYPNATQALKDAGSVGGLILAPFGGLLKGGKVRSLTGKVTEEALSDASKKAVTQGLRPTKKRGLTIQDDIAAHDKGLRALAKNKEEITAVDPTTGEPTLTNPLTGKSITTPKDRIEGLEAIQKGKKVIYDKYHQMAVEAGEKGSLFDNASSLSVLDKAEKDIGLPPKIREYAKEERAAIEELKDQPPEIIERRIADYNNSLKPFYEKGDRAGIAKAKVDMELAFELRKQLDKQIMEQAGPGYQKLKNQYGALKAMESRYAHGARLQARKPPNGFWDITDIATTPEIALGILTMNPAMIARGAMGRGVKEIIKHINNPDRHIKNAFKLAWKAEDQKKPSIGVLKRASAMAKDMKPPSAGGQGGYVGVPPAPRPPAPPSMRNFLEAPVENAGEGPARAFLGKDFPKTEFAETPANRARRLQVNKEIDEQGGLPYEQKPKPEPEKPAAPNDAEQKRTAQESGPAYDEDYQKSPDFQDVESLTPEEEAANSYIANLSEDDFGKLYDPDGPDLKGAPPELRTEIEKIRKENADAVGEETARQKSAAAEEEFNALKNVQKGNPKELDIPNRGSDREMLDKAGGAAGEDLEQVAKSYGYSWPLSEKDYEQLMRDVSARKKTLRNSFSIRKRK